MRLSLSSSLRLRSQRRSRPWPEHQTAQGARQSCGAAGSKAFAIGHAVGTQKYVCLPSGAGAKWVLFGPQATVFDEEGDSHDALPQPESRREQCSSRHVEGFDRTSAVWALKVEESDDAQFVAPGAIKWFLLQVMGAQEGRSATID